MGDREKILPFTLMGLVSVLFSSCSCSTPEASSPHIRSPPYPTTSQEETEPKNALLSFMKAVIPSTSLLSLQCAFLTSWKCKDAAKTTSAVFAIQKESEEPSLFLFGAIKRQKIFQSCKNPPFQMKSDG